MSDKFTIKLTRPVEGFGDTVNELTLREPGTDDFIPYGYPVTLINDAVNPTRQEMKIDMGALVGLISILSGLPLGSIKKLAIADFNAAMRYIISFFDGDGQLTTSG